MAEAAAELKEEPAGQAAGPPGVLRDRYLIRFNQPLPSQSMPNAEAFVAEDRRDANRRLFALVCPPELPPRVNIMRATKGVTGPGVLPLVEWGAMPTPSGRASTVVVYERPAGPKLMASLRGEIRRMDEHDIGRRVIDPLASALRELSGRGITHRAIRPTNLIYMDEACERLVLGDFVTTPPAFDQPLLFESIESAMCHPTARGGGTYSDDLYALGVTLAFLLLGRNPVAHLDDETILRLKVQQGSYSMLIGDERMALSMVEVLRGLLSDDPRQRWTMDQLSMWQQGRRLSPLQNKLERRAARGFPFQGQEYLNCRELAVAMAKNWEMAIPPVIEGKLELWLRRAVEDKERAEAVAEATRHAIGIVGDQRSSSDLMLAKVLMLLDPLAPIRYKGFHAMPDGIGAALAALIGKKADTRLIVEMILRSVPALWFEAKGEGYPDSVSVEKSFRELKNYMGQTTIGFGLERCLYEMNDALPCQSPLLAEEYVVELRELLPALNRAAASRGDSKQWPCDRHVAAFMGARARSDIDRNLLVLGEVDTPKGLLALMNLYAVFQYRLGPDTVPALATWFTNLAQQLVVTYHGRERRRELEKELPKLARRGSIVEIFNLIEDAAAREKDKSEYGLAKARYQVAEEQIRAIQTDDDERAREAQRMGQQTSAVTGILVALLVTTVVVIMKVW